MQNEKLINEICEAIDDFYLTVKHNLGRLGFEKERLKGKVEKILSKEATNGRKERKGN